MELISSILFSALTSFSSPEISFHSIIFLAFSLLFFSCFYAHIFLSALCLSLFLSQALLYPQTVTPLFSLQPKMRFVSSRKGLASHLLSYAGNVRRFNDRIKESFFSFLFTLLFIKALRLVGKNMKSCLNF